MKKTYFFFFFFSFLNSFSQSTFQKSIEGTPFGENAFSVIQTADSCFVLAGGTANFGAGGPDFYLIRTRPDGEIIWTKTYGGISNDAAYCVKQTFDGGFILVGYYDYSLVYIVKTNSTGDTVWTKTYYGGNGRYIEQTTDSGYIVSGFTDDYGAGNDDIYVLKIDAIGNIQWTKTFGASSLDYSGCVRQTTEGGYIISGQISGKMVLIKINSIGNIQWSKSYGGTIYERGEFVQQTSDGGYITTGYTQSFGAGNRDVYLVKTDLNGNLLWSKTFGGLDWDEGYSVQQTDDGGYIIAGDAASFGNGSGNSDAYLIKTDGSGNLIFSKVYGGEFMDNAYTAQQTLEGGFIVAGRNDPGHVYLIKTDSVGNSGCHEFTPNTIQNSPSTISADILPQTSTGGTIVYKSTEIYSGGKIKDLCKSEFPVVFVPTGFSPNNDGQNDVLFVRADVTLESFEFKVYDRIGEVVFQTTEITEGWNGSFNGNKMNPAVFCYIVKCSYLGKEYIFKGDVTLVK